MVHIADALGMAAEFIPHTVVQRALSTERIATAVRLSDEDGLSRINAAQADLERSGTLAQLRTRWLGSAEVDQSSAELHVND
jgi:hypothetical protein